MKSALFPGSFDPFTNGHFDLVDRALKHFDRLVIAVLSNSQKSAIFSSDERRDLIIRVCEPFGERVEVRCFDGLLVEFAKSIQVTAIVRGLRAISDYDYEAQLALANKGLYEEMETFFLMSREQNSYVSSTLVKQIARLGGDVAHLVPDVICSALMERYAA